MCKILFQNVPLKGIIQKNHVLQKTSHIGSANRGTGLTKTTKELESKAARRIFLFRKYFNFIFLFKQKVFATKHKEYPDMRSACHRTGQSISGT